MLTALKGSQFYFQLLKIRSKSLFVCSGSTSLSTLSVISRRCLVVTGSSMLTYIVLPHFGIRSQTLLPDTTSSHIIQKPERPVLALPQKSEGEQLVPLLTTLVCRGPGSNPVPPELGADTLPTELPRPVRSKRKNKS